MIDTNILLKGWCFIIKKIILILIAVITIYELKDNTNDYVIIPKDSIRFRIIPNSNTIEDINMKEKVKTEISDVINELEETNNINETRNIINEKIPIIQNKISDLFEKENYNQKFKIKYGINYFPEKIYKNVKYEAGNYESMVIEIGEAKGDNYWCVLFPPLCMIDAKESDDVEYSLFISEIINKYFK